MFEKCILEKRSTSKSEEEIALWIRGKYFLTVENNWTFRTYEYGDQRLTAQSTVSWKLLSSTTRSETAREFSVSKIEFQDEFFQFGQTTIKKTKFFRN